MSEKLGKHVTIDLWNVDRFFLEDAEYIEETLRLAARATGATILDSVFHYTPYQSHEGSFYGVTGVLILLESHASAHSWPEKGYCAIDMFTCGDCDPVKGLPTIQERFQTENVTIRSFSRGIELGF